MNKIDKVICFGKNYTDHMLELGDKPVTQPVIFLKPASIVKQAKSWSEKLVLAYSTDETIHYECELVLRLAKGGFKMTEQEASQAIKDYTIGLDMTYRDRQRKLKDNGHPWEISKIFPDSCVLAPWITPTIGDNYMLEPFYFSLNGELKQTGIANNMLFKPVELIKYASSIFPLCEGDIIFTGTPSGVGKVEFNATGTLEIKHKQLMLSWSKTI